MVSFTQQVDDNFFKRENYFNTYGDPDTASILIVGMDPTAFTNNKEEHLYNDTVDIGSPFDLQKDPRLDKNPYFSIIFANLKVLYDSYIERHPNCEFANMPLEAYLKDKLCVTNAIGDIVGRDEQNGTGKELHFYETSKSSKLAYHEFDDGKRNEEKLWSHYFRCESNKDNQKHIDALKEIAKAKKVLLTSNAVLKDILKDGKGKKWSDADIRLLGSSIYHQKDVVKDKKGLVSRAIVDKCCISKGANILDADLFLLYRCRSYNLKKESNDEEQYFSDYIKILSDKIFGS